MANAIYPKYKQRLLDPNGSAGAAVDLNTDTIKVALRNATTVYNSAHEFLSDLAGATIGTPYTLANVTVTNGVFDNTVDPTYTAVAAGSTVASYVIYKDTGVAGSSNLIAFFDTDGNAAAISIATNGGNITLVLHASGIFAL